jgi:hypothetical protein
VSSQSCEGEIGKNRGRFGAADWSIMYRRIEEKQRRRVKREEEAKAQDWAVARGILVSCSPYFFFSPSVEECSCYDVCRSDFFWGKWREGERERGRKLAKQRGQNQSNWASEDQCNKLLCCCWWGRVGSETSARIFPICVFCGRQAARSR